MKRNLWEAAHTCTKFGHKMKRKTLTIEKSNVRGWECVKCDEVILHPEDSQRMLALNKLKKGLPVKIGELGNSLVVRIPKELAAMYKMAKGGEIMLKAHDDKIIEMVLNA